MVSKIATFFREARTELSRVNWPTRRQTIRLTGVVIGISLAFAVFLGAVDFVCELVLRNILL